MRPLTPPLREGLLISALVAILATCSLTATSYPPGGYPPGSNTPAGMAVGVTVDSSNNVDISGWTGTTSGITTYGYPGYWQNGALTLMTIGGQGSSFEVNWGAADTAGNFYVAGAVGSSSTISTPVYWENGAMTSLSTGASYSYGVGNSVTVNGGSLYIVGAVGASSNNLVPCYWVGGTQYLLQFNAVTYSSGWAVSVAFDRAGNAYFAGAVASSNGNLTPAYWVVAPGPSNTAGTLATLKMTGTNTYGYALNIGVYGTTSPQSVYISGIEGASSSATAPCYWSGSTSGGVANAPTDLPLGVSNTTSDLNWGALDASGDFYLVGDVGSSSNSVPCYWEVTSGNPTPGPTYLPTGSGNPGGEADGIAFDSSSNVYIAGSVGQFLPCYWKSNVLNMLTTGNAEDLQLVKNIGGKPSKPWWRTSGRHRF